MDARLLATLWVVCCWLAASPVWGASVRTANFVVHAPTQEIAEKAGKCAEFWRKELSVQWLNQELPNWAQPCPIQVNVGQRAASGATTFSFDRGEVFGWNMEVNGTLERILDSVIPHEVNHTILASYFRRPLPRWADEGAATLVEADSERRLQMQTLNDVFKTQKRIPLQQLLDIKEYPADRMQVYALYAEGYSLADFLVQQHGDNGRYVYLHFLQTAFEQGWETAISKHYKFAGIQQLEGAWSNWIMAGSPPLLPEGQMLADNSAGNAPEAPGLVVRGQTPEPTESAPQTVTAGTEPLPPLNRRLRTAPVADRDQIRPTAFLSPELPSTNPTTLPAVQPIPPVATGIDEFRWAAFPEARTQSR